MKKKAIILVGCILMVIVGPLHAKEFSLTSPQLSQGGVLIDEMVLDGFGCRGDNISPTLDWHNSPAGTKSYGVTLYDPDAPTGSGWWHWVMFNIPKNINSLHKGAGNPKTDLAPKRAIQSRTDFGRPGYGGACPPSGDRPHRYVFTVYALDTAAIKLDDTASAAMVGFFLHQHTIEKAELTVTYAR